MVARNAWKGGHRPILRELSRMLSDGLERNQDMLDSVLI